MAVHYSEEETVASVSLLTRTRLVAFVQAEVIAPIQTTRGPVFDEADLARLELLCELSDQFSLDEDGLGIILSLIDQLHTARWELRAMARAVQDEREEVRRRIGIRLREPTEG